MSMATMITVALWPVILSNLIVAGINMSGKAPWSDWSGKSFIASIALMDIALFGLTFSVLSVATS